MGNPNYLSVIVGNEEEYRANIGGRELDEDSYTIIKMMGELCGAALVGDYSINGSRFYYDNGPESSTPECVDPAQLAVYINANALLYQTALTRLAIQRSEAQDGPVIVQTHRRVIDEGETYGCHDNLSLRSRVAAWLRGETNNNTRRLALGAILAHLAARSFIVGAGLVMPDRLYFSQKRSREHRATMDLFKIHVVKDLFSSHREGRFESRDSDINLSDLAVMLRVAGTAGVLALAQTPLLRKIASNHGLTPYLTPHPLNPINILELQNDGGVRASPALHAAVDFEERLADMMLDDYPRYGERMPEGYSGLFRLQSVYCQMFRDILHRKRTIHDLYGWSDWATKFCIIQQDIHNTGVNKAGRMRSLCDEVSQFRDRRYDHYGVIAQDGEARQLLFGYAHTLRQAGRYVMNLQPEYVFHAMLHPPPQSRAYTRVNIIQNHPDVTNVHWTYVEVNNVRYTLYLES